MLNVTHIEVSGRRHITTINQMRDTVRKLERSLKCSRDLEAARFLQYSTLKSRDKVLTDDLKKIKIRNKQMLNVQLSSLDILPETLRREVQKTWHQKYDALLSQNEQLKKQIIAIDSAMKQKQKEIDMLEQRLLIAGSIIKPKENTKKFCRRF
ncbi:uncharacterized protein LOC105202595 isoform X2 [Solenopsis invicta]|uniref:uncharacterized protein LOC105202595 isoform X2 n=1 Tax=Solenopsis invicta TaxID=13686 RepID=UPI00193D746F|nr:uncharacterized protein LOC105202595 isoform X2 [Solenopsis invicta]